MDITGTYTTQHGELTIAQNGNNITATYQENGVCSGKLVGNTVEGIWRNKQDQGLFEWKFDGHGSFTGKYKTGIDAGPMKGRWHGKSTHLAGAAEGAVQLGFEVVQENGGTSVLSFEKDFTHLSFSVPPNQVTVEDYHNIIMEQAILQACKAHILKADPVLLEDADAYILCVTKVNDIDLGFLWSREVPDENGLNALKQFLPKNSEDINAESYEDIVSEFRSDYVCSLSYVKAF